VPHLVEALPHKLEGRGFDSRWCNRLKLSGRTNVLGLHIKCRILPGVVGSFALDSVFQTEGWILGTHLWNLGI